MLQTRIIDRPAWLRFPMGGVYLLGGLVHAFFWINDPAIYEEFGHLALLDSYRELWNGLVVPNLGHLVPMVVVFEIGVGLAVLGRGPIARAGNLFGGGFQLALVPSGPWGPINLGFAVLHAYLLRLTAPESKTRPGSSGSESGE